ncbi:hypothetical protein RBH94_10055 [Aestuariibaculum sp. YM273]|uniref:hypothetical protein n=1 Tax=Aestuariibaculum sp. YM273 TaxID=3070659 RepID=UPI0027DAE60F|nr:hypothetical protein [Aestuariibaculum sp. YM273]WMI64405.1 hypothetical protein RBH94_10055 [Aestuariibaculum sp. YM273]
MKSKYSFILFNQRKNKTFNYRPRFSKENEEVTDGEAPEKHDFISKWEQTRTSKRRVKGAMSIRTLLLILVLLLICMYILDSKFN